MRKRFQASAVTGLCLLTAACVAGPAGAALWGLSLLGEVIGATQPAHGGRKLLIDPNKATSDSLSRAQANVDPRCKATLAHARASSPKIKPLEPGECRMTLVCLGGMSQPMAMSVCAPGERNQTPIDMADVAQTSGADSVWSWSAPK